MKMADMAMIAFLCSAAVRLHARIQGFFRAGVVGGWGGGGGGGGGGGVGWGGGPGPRASLDNVFFSPQLILQFRGGPIV